MSKYNRTYHLPFSKGATSDDRVAESTTGLLGREIVITEKLDGENTGMERGGVYARSHAEYTCSPWSKEVRQLHTVKVGPYIEEGLMLFGENMEGVHSIEYDCLESYFYLFGARKDGVWSSWKEVEEYSYLLDIPTVPVLFKGVVNTEVELEELVNTLISRGSRLGGVIEGVVVRVEDSFYDDDFPTSLQKWVRRDHVTTDEHWTRNWRKANLILI
jgi:hypothetical protein